MLSFIAACNERMREFKGEATSTQISHWSISPEHPLFKKLEEFDVRCDLLPVPDNATLDIPDRYVIVNYNYHLTARSGVNLVYTPALRYLSSRPRAFKDLRKEMVSRYTGTSIQTPMSHLYLCYI